MKSPAAAADASALPARAPHSPLQRRRAALLRQGRHLRASLVDDLDELGSMVSQPSRMQAQLFALGRAMALRSLAGIVQHLVLPRWARMARLLLRGWRLWHRLRG